MLRPAGGRRIFLPDGERYEGSTLDDARHGAGTCHYFNGDKYDGQVPRSPRQPRVSIPCVLVRLVEIPRARPCGSETYNTPSNLSPRPASDLEASPGHSESVAPSERSSARPGPSTGRPPAHLAAAGCRF